MAKETQTEGPPPSREWYSPASLWSRKSTIITAISITGIAVHLALRVGFHASPGKYQFMVQGIHPATWWEKDRATKATRIAIGLWEALLAALVGLIWLLRKSSV